MLLPVVLGTPLLYAECLQTPFHFRLPFPPCPPPLHAGVVYISGCSEGKTNGILHKYLPPTLVFRNYQTTLPSSHSRTLSSRPLPLALTPAIFQRKTSCFASVSSRTERWMEIDRWVEGGGGGGGAGREGEGEQRGGKVKRVEVDNHV